ncbi:hypothetical protein DH2020_014599 [Rehmannia glutinosa]|uniref:Uncharacterized protein n=1 Tax=Rehmannia glutinosa TaxID=99300 RepID=A0ABR0X078_REHGL
MGDRLPSREKSDYVASRSRRSGGSSRIRAVSISSDHLAKSKKERAKNVECIRNCTLFTFGESEALAENHSAENRTAENHSAANNDAADINTTDTFDNIVDNDPGATEKQDTSITMPTRKSSRSRALPHYLLIYDRSIPPSPNPQQSANTTLMGKQYYSVKMVGRNPFSDSNDVSGGSSSTCCAGTATGTELSPSPDQLLPDVAALKRLSDTLESIFFDTSSPPDFDFFADARLIAASGREIPVHRCILSARSLFFKNLFVNRERNAKLELKEVMKEYDVGYDALVTVLAYVYSGKVRASPKDVCVCVDDECSHLACRPAVAFMVEVLYASFVFQINELVARFQRNLMDILDKATADDILMVLSVANMCGTVCESLLARSIELVVKSDLDVITLDKALPHHLTKQINESRIELGLVSPESNIFPDKHVKRIHRALESDDVELVRMLLKEEQTNLDDAYALHYAVAYCDSKTTTELLDLAIADINHRNPRGYTVLHVAAMRKDPKIIVSLLTKGARPSDLTSDGRKALQISKRLTRAIDYHRSAEGKATPKDRLCIEILEQAERRDPLLGEASMSLAMAGDDLRTKLLYLENRGNSRH